MGQCFSTSKDRSHKCSKAVEVSKRNFNQFTPTKPVQLPQRPHQSKLKEKPPQHSTRSLFQANKQINHSSQAHKRHKSTRTCHHQKNTLNSQKHQKTLLFLSLSRECFFFKISQISKPLYFYTRHQKKN